MDKARERERGGGTPAGEDREGEIEVLNVCMGILAPPPPIAPIVTTQRLLYLFVCSSDYIARYGRMTEGAARRKFWQILSAVEYCHNRRVVHRDLKVSNPHTLRPISHWDATAVVPVARQRNQ
uniref:Protein kinase domain-containing protein n=1 Tax=Timema douglasi TaxID=61478 RepID=A0A7R8Z7J8_TIMDO|nr:unnamed protein product [Timema douglasi]